MLLPINRRDQLIFYQLFEQCCCFAFAHQYVLFIRAHLSYDTAKSKGVSAAFVVDSSANRSLLSLRSVNNCRSLYIVVARRSIPSSLFLVVEMFASIYHAVWTFPPASRPSTSENQIKTEKQQEEQLAFSSRRQTDRSIA